MVGIWVPAEARVQLLAEGGGIRANVVETKVGGLPVKLDISGAIGQPIAAATKAVLPLDRFRVSGVSSQDGSVTVDLVAR